MDRVAAYYETIDEETRFSRNSRRIEYLTTTHVLDPLLPRQACILDVGAGTGVYSLYYAERQHKMTAVDLTPKHIDVLREKAEARGLKIEAKVGNAVDLSDYDADSYDIVLCLGPLYHLTDPHDRDRCIRECLRVLKPGGLLAVAYINKYSCLPMLATRDRSFIRPSVIDKVVRQGVITEGDADCFWTDAYFTTPDEIEALLARHGVVMVDHAGTDGISHTIDKDIDQLDAAAFEAWMSYHYETCRERSIMGFSTHGLYVGQVQQA